MNFQYLEHLEVEFLNSNFNLKEAVLSVEENSSEKSSSYEEKAVQENTSSEGLILKELSDNLKYAFLQPEKAKPFITSAELTDLEEQKTAGNSLKIQGSNSLVYRRFERNHSFKRYAQDPVRGEC